MFVSDADLVARKGWFKGMIVLDTAWFFLTNITCALLLISGFVYAVQHNLRQTKSTVTCQVLGNVGGGIVRVCPDLNAVQNGCARPTFGRGH